MRTDSERQLAAVGAAMLPLFTAMALVGARGEIDPAVTALVLAITVVAGARIGGRRGGVAAALMAAVSFDFFHTKPYLSLKISDATDIFTTLLLLVVGLAVGGVAHRAERDRRRVHEHRSDATSLTRVLAIAAEGSAEDVELSIRAELLTLMSLRDCFFAEGTPAMKAFDRSGAIRVGDAVSMGGDLALPEDGVAIPVSFNENYFGYLAAIPVPGAIVSAESRQVAVAMAEVLGLALAAAPAGA